MVLGFTAPPTLVYVMWAPEESPAIGVTPCSFRCYYRSTCSIGPRDLYPPRFNRQSRTAPGFLMPLGITAGSQRKVGTTCNSAGDVQCSELEIYRVSEKSLYTFCFQCALAYK